MYFSKLFSAFYSSINYYADYACLQYNTFNVDRHVIISSVSEYFVSIITKLVDTQKSNKEIYNFIKRCIKVKAYCECRDQLRELHNDKNYVEYRDPAELNNTIDTYFGSNYLFVKFFNKIELSYILTTLENILITDQRRWKNQKIKIKKTLAVLKNNPAVTQAELSKEFSCSKEAIHNFYGKLRRVLINNMEVLNVSDCISLY